MYNKYILCMLLITKLSYIISVHKIENEKREKLTTEIFISI